MFSLALSAYKQITYCNYLFHRGDPGRGFQGEISSAPLNPFAPCRSRDGRRASPARRATRHRPPRSRSAGSRRLLIMDDSGAIARLAARPVRSLCHRVAVASPTSSPHVTAA